jgi:glutamate-1-semialdehyde 2,1-aminomutase
MGNGFSISALVGKKEIMELGGLHHKKEKVFLLSTTFGAETHSLAAAIATMKIYQNEPVIDHLYRQGERLIKGIDESVRAHNLQGYFGTIGKACNLLYYTRDENKQPSQPLRTLFLQEMIKHGIIAPSLVVSYSHQDQEIDKTLEAIHQALFTYRKALEQGVEKYLVGPPVKPVMRKYN